MKLATYLSLAYRAVTELGPGQLGLYALYQFGLRTGHYQRQLTASLNQLGSLNRISSFRLQPCLPVMPDRDVMLSLLGDQVEQLFNRANEIVEGKVRLFDGQPVELILASPQPISAWMDYVHEDNSLGGKDIKLIWEPGRFGWACTLAMAYHLSTNESYINTFWFNFDRFTNFNPPYLGPHWASAQEAAIRIIALAFSIQIFNDHHPISTERLKNIAETIATHAERIPPTMVYARSQNNNHLILEALGLYTASALLPEHPLAPKWHKLGWNWLQYAFRTQIEQDGTYIQHSTNYHRLMLQAALWVLAVHDHAFAQEPIPTDFTSRLAASAKWLWKLVDPESGHVPNLGHNDGAYILPLTVCPYEDYRPVIHAAARAFLHSNLVPEGPWGEMSYWLGFRPDSILPKVEFDSLRGITGREPKTTQSPHILQNKQNNSWAYFRVARFHSRPAHADQLHLDLWWHGLNLAQDPGTYQYNSSSPWDNSLMTAMVHNAVVIDGQDIMVRAGRFLYLDWAQADVIDINTDTDDHLQSMAARHHGYQKFRVRYSRKVTACDDGRWEVIDHLDGQPVSLHTARLHWLLPDWEYEIQDTTDRSDYPGFTVRIRSPFGWIILNSGASSAHRSAQLTQAINIKLVRVSKLLFGSGEFSPISGWTSPTYGEKIPALACILEVNQSLPIELKSEWIFPHES